jgi:leader peptidase (prepilin peptidase)/N-methyltransferase
MTAVIKGIIFAALLIYAAYTDIKRREIDDWVSISIIITSLIGTDSSLSGAVITALPFFISAFFKSGSIGGGDIKLMFACGAVLGICGGLVQIIAALSLVTVFALLTSITKGVKACKSAVPLAPFLCAGGIFSYTIIYFGGIVF